MVSISKGLAVALAAGVMATTLPVGKAAAQSAVACPCMTSGSIDMAYASLGFIPGQVGTKQYCVSQPQIVAMNQTETKFIEVPVDDDGAIVDLTTVADPNTVEFEPRKVNVRALEADLQAKFGTKLASCMFQTTHNDVIIREFAGAMTDQEYAACVAEIKSSSTWSALSCQM